VTPFRAGPLCPDHRQDARYCHDCWQEILAGTRPDTHIGKHYEPPVVGALDVKEPEHA
jgi:hypothetical protein